MADTRSRSTHGRLHARCSTITIDHLKTLHDMPPLTKMDLHVDGAWARRPKPWGARLPARRLHRALAAVVTSCWLSSAWAQPFEFVALGDLPYGQDQQVGSAYRALISTINRHQPAFSIHVGDIKSGSSPCSDEEFQRQLQHFGLFDAAVVYTPGDNEWTDCHRSSNGGFDPIERLQALRRMFFPAGRSLGTKPLTLESQSRAMPEHAKFVENRRWMHRGVLFVTLHLVGSNNNFDKRRPQAMAEAAERDRANIAWIRDSFSQAKKQGAQALVFGMQANPFGLLERFWGIAADSPYRPTIRDTLLPLARDNRLPVLVVHGDTHTFRFDQPFSLDGKTLEQVTRLEVPGGSDVRAVRVLVDPVGPTPFTVRLISAD